MSTDFDIEFDGPQSADSDSSAESGRAELSNEASGQSGESDDGMLSKRDTIPNETKGK